MRQVMVRYKVKPEHAAENEALVRAVYEELAERQPEGLRYATYKLDDGVSFVHVARSTGDVLSEVAAFRRFQEGIRERCDEPPVVTEVDEVGSYR
jgi:hypothetical protein